MNRKRPAKVAAVAVLWLSSAAMIAGSTAAESQPTGGDSAVTTPTLVRRDNGTIILRGGSANSDFNFGTGLFANGITDYIGRLVAGENCQQSDAHTVSCGQLSPSIRVRGTLGTGNDFIGAIIPLRFVEVFGGAGHDEFVGSIYRDRFLGGPGNDILWGEQGPDYLVGGKGADVIRGGPGWDVADVDRFDRVYGVEVKK